LIDDIRSWKSWTSRDSCIHVWAFFVLILSHWKILVFVTLNMSGLSSFNHINLSLIEDSGALRLHINLLIWQRQDALAWIFALIQRHVVMQIFLIDPHRLNIVLINRSIIEILKDGILIVNLCFCKGWIFSSCLSWNRLIILTYFLILLHINDLIASRQWNEFSVLLNEILIWL